MTLRDVTRRDVTRRDRPRRRGPGAAGRLGLAALLLAGALSPARAADGPAAPADPFAACLAGLAASAEAAGVPGALARAQLAGLAPDPEVLAATTRQGEFVRPIWSYLDGFVTEARIAEGRRLLVERASTFAAVEAAYGVDRHVLAAIWGIESSYGAALDDPGALRPVVRSLATLACLDPGRAAYWRGELAAALAILASGEAPLDRLPGGELTGSWAGAMGHTQFMPSTYRARAVDFDGDGRRDIWTSVPDALASTANDLAASGWRRGERWGYEARLREGFDLALADETTRRTLTEWAALGARPVDGPDVAPESPATLILPAGARGPAFLLLPNFAAILRYHAALSYALAVGLLSDRLRGGPGLAQDWPRGDRALGADEVRDLQARLEARGHPVGGVDGKVGPRTRAALRADQAAAGLPPDGYADAAALERLRAGP